VGERRAASEVAAAVAALGRRVVAAGLVVASGGNIAARVPGRDEIVVTPAGGPLDDLDPSSLPVVTAAGESLAGTGEPTTELALHLAAFAARPDARVCIHLHPPVATLLHALGVPIRCITTDHALYVGRPAEVPYLPPGSPELATAVASALGRADIVLLRHHGCAVVSDDFDLAFSRVVNLEAAAVATYRAAAIGVAAVECPPGVW
jgi:L-fuculose-phosphate aldolase